MHKSGLSFGHFHENSRQKKPKFKNKPGINYSLSFAIFVARRAFVLGNSFIGNHESQSEVFFSWQKSVKLAVTEKGQNVTIDIIPTTI